MQSPAAGMASNEVRRNNDSERLPQGVGPQMTANERKLANARPFKVGVRQLMLLSYLCLSALICGLLLVSAISTAQRRKLDRLARPARRRVEQ